MRRLPLEKHKVFESRDVEEIRDRVGKIFCPHRIDAVGRAPELDARMHCRRLRNVAMTYVSYGWDVRVTPGELHSFFAVLAPTAGRGTFQCGYEQAQADSRNICVVTPTEPLSMRLSGDCGNLVIRIERSAVEARLAQMIDGALREPIRFKLGMDVTAGFARSWYGALTTAVSDLDSSDSMLTHPLWLEQFEETLITGLLLAQPHNYSSMLNGEDRPLPSRLLGIAVDLIEGHPDWTHTTASLARQAGVSVRALQKAFREQLDSSPSEYLRGVRLQRVHDELCAAQHDTTTVGEVAAKWGLAHHGRFAAVYRERFGESPKQTLAR